MVKIQLTPLLNLRHYFLYVEYSKVWMNIKSHPNIYHQTLLELFSSFLSAAKIQIIITFWMHRYYEALHVNWNINEHIMACNI